MDFTQRLTMGEAAAYLGHSKSWLQQKRVQLGIPFYPIGGQYFFIKEELDLWIIGQRDAKLAKTAKKERILVDITL